MPTWTTQVNEGIKEKDFGEKVWQEKTLWIKGDKTSPKFEKDLLLEQKKKCGD